MAAGAPLPLGQLRAADVHRAGVTFTDGEHIYQTTGKPLGQGGMGLVTYVQRRPARGPQAGAPLETVVAKTFKPEVLATLRQDATARRHLEHNQLVLARLRAVEHPNVLPIYVTSAIADNHLFVTPLAGDSLYAVLASGTFSPKDRVRLLVEAVRGLAALHDAGIIHRDFTLHNVLTMGAGKDGKETRRAVVFDFDLSIAPGLIPQESARTWQAHYQGRVAGSPEFSVTPELLDDVLGKEAMSPRIDVYAVGTSLYGVFTDESLYGEVPDLPTLLYRVSEGLVRRGQSRIEWPRDIPAALRPIIEKCLEREPAQRFADATAVLKALKDASAQLSARKGRGRFRMTMGYVHEEKDVRHKAVFAERLDPSVTYEEIVRADETLGRQGYLIEKSLGRVGRHPIYLALPDPMLLATGKFPDTNTYRKVVTVMEMQGIPDGDRFVETWLGRIKPIVDKVRQGYLTSLFKAVHDPKNDQFLLFTEYVADPRFGTELAKHELFLEEVFALGLLLAAPIRKLHAEGLAHNNIRAEALLFKGVREAGKVVPLLVGLVQPSFAPEAMEEDVRNLAGLLCAWLRETRIAALRPEVRDAVELLRDAMARTAANETPTPKMDAFAEVIAQGLCLVDDNFEIIKTYGGDVGAYANLIVGASLYGRLFAGK